MKKVKCPYCEKEVTWLTDHLAEHHGISRQDGILKIVQTRENEIYKLEKEVNE